MAGTFIDLPAPAANQSGAAVDVSQLAAHKTIVVTGAGDPFVLIEVALDAAGVNWSPLTMFRASGERTFTVACRWMRATVSNYKTGPAPSVSVGSDVGAAMFAALDVPASNGSGTPSDVSLFPQTRTVQVTGDFTGAVAIEVSNDGGTSYAAAWVFLPDQHGIRTAIVTAELVRVSRAGVAGGDEPVVSIAGAIVRSDVSDGYSYGAMHFHDPGTATPIAALATFVKADNVSHLHAHSADIAMPANNRLEYTGVPAVAVMVTAALSFKCSLNNQVLAFAIAVNGAVDTPSIIRTKIATGTDIQAVTVICMRELAAGDYVEVWVANDSTGAGTITIDHANVVIQAQEI